MTRKSTNSIILILILTAVFGTVFYYMSNPSTKLKALKLLKQTQNVESVHSLWQIHQKELADNKEFVLSVKEKLQGFNLTEAELLDCQTWLPEPPTSLNLIIVPDLSNRITDSKNNPHQNRFWRFLYGR